MWLCDHGLDIKLMMESYMFGFQLCQLPACNDSGKVIHIYNPITKQFNVLLAKEW